MNSSIGKGMCVSSQRFANSLGPCVKVNSLNVKLDRAELVWGLQLPTGRPKWRQHSSSDYEFEVIGDKVRVVQGRNPTPTAGRPASGPAREPWHYYQQDRWAKISENTLMDMMPIAFKQTQQYRFYGQSQSSEVCEWSDIGVQFIAAVWFITAMGAFNSRFRFPMEMYGDVNNGFAGSFQTPCSHHADLLEMLHLPDSGPML